MNEICPFCGKLPKTEEKYSKDSFGKITGEFLAAKCITNACQMSLMNWMLIDDWNKRFVVNVNGKDYFVGDEVGIKWYEEETDEDIIIPMTISSSDNGAYYLIPPDNPPIECWKIHIHGASDDNESVEFIELKEKE